MINSERKTVGYRVKNKINRREENVRCLTVTQLSFGYLIIILRVSTSGATYDSVPHAASILSFGKIICKFNEKNSQKRKVIQSVLKIKKCNLE